MSEGPPGSTWADADPAAPMDADATRGRHLRELLHGRAFAYALVLGSVAVVIAGALLHSLAAVLAGPALVTGVALTVAFALADRQSEADFFRAYAGAHGLSYTGFIRTLPLTPLLAAGDERRCDHWMQGPVAADVSGGLGHYTYEVRRRDRQGRAQRSETRHFTICVVELESGIKLFPGIFLCKQRGLFGAIDGHDWLSHHDRHEVELESAQLCERYELWVDDAQDELLFRELFVPSLQVLLAEHPLEPCFEYRAGTLVVYVERRLEEEGHLGWMREVTAKVAGHFAGEIAEAGAAVTAACPPTAARS